MGRLTVALLLVGISALVEARPHPPVATTAVAPDADGDGLPQAWEEAYELDDTDPNADTGPQGDPDGDGATNLQEFEAGTHPRGAYVEYFAEGANGATFTTQLALANPDPQASAAVLVRYLSPSGAAVSTFVTVPARAHRSIDTAEVPGLSGEFAIEVTSSRPVVAARTMHWYGGAADGHAEASTPSPSRTWLFAEGATHSGFELFYLIYNPGTTTAQVTLEYLFESGPPLRRVYSVGPGARSTIWCNREDARLAAAAVSARFHADRPVVVERSMYTTGPDGRLRAGHAAVGTTVPSATWYFAEGATGPFFDAFLLLLNPADQPTDVEVSFLRPEGSPVIRTYRVAARQRHTVWVDQVAPELAATSVGMHVRALDGTPIVAERAMWWPGDGTGYRAGHVTAGLQTPSPAWVFAGGRSLPAESASTYVLVANPGGGTLVRVTLLPEDGPGAEREIWVAAHSRVTIQMEALFAEAVGRRYGVLLEALAPGASVVAEQAQYETAGGVMFRAGMSIRGRDPRRVLLPPVSRRLDRGAAPVLLDDLVSPGRTVALEAESSAPGVATVAVVDGRMLRVTPQPGTSGAVVVTVTATTPEGLRETQRFAITIGHPRTETHVASLSGPGTYTLPGVGQAATTYDETIIENVGTTTVTGIELFEQGRDWSTVDRILASATHGLASADEKARALWQFARTYHVPWWSATINTDLHDPVVVFNGFGYVFCDDISSALGLLFERAGMPARMWNLGIDRHTVVEAYYDGQWHMFDASLDGLFLERDNRTVAGVDDIMADPDLVARGGWRQAFAYGIWTTPGHLSYPASLLAREGRRLGLTLRPGERVALAPVARTGRRFVDGSLVPPPGLEPPVLGGGVLESRLDGRTPGAVDLLRLAAHVSASPRGLIRTAGVAEAIFEVASPWPVVGGRLRAVMHPGAAGETIAVDVTASGTGFDFDWSELVSGRFRVPGLYVADGNLRTYAPDRYGPAVHNGPSSLPGYVEYRLRPRRDAGARTLLRGQFYRASGNDIVAVQVSADGERWQTTWTMDAVGGASLEVDLTAALATCDPCGLRLLVQGAAAASAGFDALAMEGVEPFGWTTVWSAASEGLDGSTPVDVPLDGLVRDYAGAMVFGYHVRLRLAGASGTPAAVESLALDTHVQVAPQSIATPGSGPVQVVYRTTSTAPQQVRVTHRWQRDTSHTRPPAPLPAPAMTDAAFDARAPFHLEWAYAPDADGDVLVTYHVQVCEQPDCRYPISSVFDERGTFSQPGPDGLFGTSDDGPALPIISTHWMYLHTWLRAGATYSWRVRVQDSSGLWSDWSPLSRFRVTAQALP